jgi:hypothetical protein
MNRRSIVNLVKTVVFSAERPSDSDTSLFLLSPVANFLLKSKSRAPAPPSQMEITNNTTFIS